MAQYIKSRVGASIAVLEDDESWPPEFLDWSGEPLAYSRYRGTTPAGSSATLGTPNPRAAACLADPNGSLVIVNDGQFYHILHGTKLLPPSGLKRLHSVLADASDVLAKGMHGSPDLEIGRASCRVRVGQYV